MTKAGKWGLGIGAAILGVAVVAWSWSRRGGVKGTPIKLQIDASFYTSPSPDQQNAGNAVRVAAGATVYIADDQAQVGDFTPVYLPGRGASVYWTSTANLIQLS